jgi:hypothetical protein
MKLTGKAWFTLAIMLMAVGIIVQALQWPFEAALFPMIVGIPLLIFATIHFITLVFVKHAGNEEAVDFKLSELEDKAVEKKRKIEIFSWIVGFFFLVLFVGFPIAVPLFVFCYMKFQGKEPLKTCLIFTFVAWGSFYGLFVWFCDLPFMAGWLQQGLTAIGILS